MSARPGNSDRCAYISLADILIRLKSSTTLGHAVRSILKSLEANACSRNHFRTLCISGSGAASRVLFPKLVLKMGRCLIEMEIQWKRALISQRTALKRLCLSLRSPCENVFLTEIFEIFVFWNYSDLACVRKQLLLLQNMEVVRSICL